MNSHISRKFVSANRLKMTYLKRNFGKICRGWEENLGKIRTKNLVWPEEKCIAAPIRAVFRRYLDERWDCVYFQPRHVFSILELVPPPSACTDRGLASKQKKQTTSLLRQETLEKKQNFPADMYTLGTNKGWFCRL